MATKTKQDLPDTPEPWSAKRWKQLELLRHILFEAKSLNRGSNIIRRIQEIEKACDALLNDKFSIANGRHEMSLIRFLEQHARYSYATRKRTAKPKQEQR